MVNYCRWNYCSLSLFMARSIPPSVRIARIRQCSCWMASSRTLAYCRNTCKFNSWCYRSIVTQTWNYWRDMSRRTNRFVTARSLHKPEDWCSHPDSYSCFRCTVDSYDNKRTSRACSCSISGYCCVVSIGNCPFSGCLVSTSRTFLGSW